MKSIWISGAAGFVGSNLVKALSNKGYVPKCFDDLSLGKLSNLEGNYTFEKGTILDFEAVKKSMAGCDTVIHLAALPRINPSILEPLPAHAVNLTGTLNVLEAARQNNVEQFIYAGSSSIFGKESVMPLKEDSPKRPNSPYAYQKLASEGYLHLYNRLYGLNSTILRFFNAFGSKMPQTGSYAIVAGIFMYQKAYGLPLTIKGTGEQKRDFTWVGDICQGIITAAEKRVVGTYHLGSGTQVSINQLAEAIDPGGKREHLEASKGDYPETLADITKAKEALGFKPTVQVLDWIKENLPTNMTLPKNTEVVYST